MSKPTIVLFSGHSGTGKGECARILTDFLNAKHPEHPNPVARLSFANALKETIADMMKSCFNETININDMDVLEFKERTWGDEMMFRGKPLRIRDMLIHYGMLFREHNPDVWVDIVIHKIQDTLDDGEWNTDIAPIYYIIDDNRFINEVEKIITSQFGIDGNTIQFDVIGYRIFRTAEIKQSHGSESQIDDIEEIFNFTRVNNDGTLEELENVLMKEYENAFSGVTNEFLNTNDDEIQDSSSESDENQN